MQNIWQQKVFYVLFFFTKIEIFKNFSLWQSGKQMIKDSLKCWKGQFNAPSANWSVFASFRVAMIDGAPDELTNSNGASLRIIHCRL